MRKILMTHMELLALLQNRLTEVTQRLPSYDQFRTRDLESLYAVGYSFYMQGQYRKAYSFFILLSTYRPLSGR